MTIGSPEWLKATSHQLAVDAQDKLDDISKTAAEHSGILKAGLAQPDILLVAFYANELQDKSFMLGVYMGLGLAISIANTPEE